MDQRGARAILGRLENPWEELEKDLKDCQDQDRIPDPIPCPEVLLQIEPTEKKRLQRRIQPSLRP